MTRNDTDTESTVDHVEFGTVEHEDPGAPNDGTWDTFEVDQQEVAFDWGFETPPTVIVEPDEETSVGVHRAIDVSTTGFGSRWFVYDEESDAVDAQWAAFGTAAQSRGHEPVASERQFTPGGPWPTETQELNISSLHDYSQLVDALERIERKGSGRVDVESIGESNEGREIFLATVGEGETDVFLFAEQHADEATGCEALLNLLDQMAAGGNQFDEVLEELTVHVVPRANPDGVEVGDLRHRYNVDPDAPARNGSEGIYTAHDGAGIGWDLNRYHWVDWTESELYQHRPDDYPTNPATEAAILAETIEAIDPLWVADYHNQYHYVSDDDENETGSILWPTAPEAEDDAVMLSKQLCRAIYDDVDSDGYANLSRFPGGDALGIARNSYGAEGIACVLIELRGQTTEFGQKSGGVLIKTAYDMAVSMLTQTTQGTVFDVDPDDADDIPDRGDRYQRTFHPAETEETEAEAEAPDPRDGHICDA